MLDSIEIARQDGHTRRIVTLDIDGDGLKLCTEDSGATVKRMFDADTYEFTTSISAEHVRALAMAALGELLKGNTDADAQLKALCDLHGIQYRFHVETHGIPD